MESQTPTLPDPSALKDLSPSVAITFLVAVVIVALLVYFGGPIRDRMKRRGSPDPDQAPRTPPAGPSPTLTSPGAVADVAERRTEQFIDNLLRQVEDCAAENDRIERRAEEDIRRAEKRSTEEVARLERRVDELERQTISLREENERLRMQLVLWQRGPQQ